MILPIHADEAPMWRLVFPLFIFGAAGYVYWEGHNLDARFVLFPLMDRIPGVGEDLVARADASAVILVVVGLISAAIQVVWGIRARERERALEEE